MSKAIIREAHVEYKFRILHQTTLTQRMAACAIAGFNWRPQCEAIDLIITTSAEVANRLRQLPYLANFSNQIIYSPLNPTNHGKGTEHGGGTPAD